MSASVPGAGLEPRSEPVRPRPGFEVVNARAARRAAAPTLIFEVEIEDPSRRPVFTISLSTQIAIEPARRGYDDDTRERLTELLGEAGGSGAPTRTMPWTRVDVLVQPFEGRTRVELPVLCSYDLEVGSTGYFRALADGEVPLVFHFNGSVYYDEGDGRLQIVQISWEESSDFGLPIETWREMIAIHYPLRSWVPADESTVERLRRFRLQRGLPSYDAALDALLGESE